MGKAYPHLVIPVIQQASVGLMCPRCKREFTRHFRTGGEFIDSWLNCPNVYCKETIKLRIEWSEAS